MNVNNYSPVTFDFYSQVPINRTCTNYQFLSPIPPCMSLFPPVQLLIFEISSQLIAFQDEILRISIKMLNHSDKYYGRNEI